MKIKEYPLENIPTVNVQKLIFIRFYFYFFIRFISKANNL